MKFTVTGLPERQGQALLHTAEGATRKEAARIMGCSAQNVIMLLNTVKFKLHARSTPEAVAIAFQRGILRMLALATMFGAITTGLPAPASASQDDDQQPLIRRIRTRTARSGMRRIRTRDHFDIAVNDPRALSGLTPVLIWDDGLFVVYQ